MRTIKINRSNIPVLIILIILIISLTACGKKVKEEPISENKETKESENESENTTKQSPFIGETILTVGDEEVLYSEAILYLKYIQTYYENIYGNAIWDYDLGDYTIGELAKKDVINIIIQRKIAKKQWEEYKIEITEEDEVKLKNDSKDYLKNIKKDDTDLYGINIEHIYQFFFDNLMAERVFDAATMDVDTNVSDEIAKQITIQYLLISTNKSDTKPRDTTEIEKEKNAAYTKAQELLSTAVAVEDFSSFAKSNTDSVEVEVTIGKNDLEKSLEDAAFALKAGEMSNIVEASDGYYIIYCVDDYNEDATLEKKEEIIDQRQNEKFVELFEKWQKETKFDLNEKVWNQIKFD